MTNSQHVQMVSHDQLPPLPMDDFGAPPPPQVANPRGPARPDAGVPLFEIVAIRKADGTYANVEYVSILTPGDPKAVPRHKVNDALRQQYRPWYDRFRAGMEMTTTGVPLEMWPVLTPAQVHALKAINIFSVEQLTQIADSNLHHIPMGQTLRRQATEWLRAKKDADAVENNRRERDTLLDGQRMLEQQVAELTRRLAEKDAVKEVAIPVAHIAAEAADVAAGLSEALALDAAQPRRGPGRPPNPKS